MSTFVALNASFAKTYPINRREFSPCFGRYEEDIYDGNGFSGGNPWFLTTLAAAEYLYTIIPHILHPTGILLGQCPLRKSDQLIHGRVQLLLIRANLDRLSRRYLPWQRGSSSYLSRHKQRKQPASRIHD